MKKLFYTITILVLTTSFALADFSLSFEWGDTPACNTGQAKKVQNPVFTLTDVPEGTKILQFKMKDKQSSFNHGGGKVEYTGQTTIEPGAFKYYGPCPPGVVHTYVWTVTARNDKKKKIGKAKAQREFPE